jgi:hypothetical protein
MFIDKNGIVKIAAVAAGGFLVYQLLFGKRNSFSENSRNEISGLASENKKMGIKPSASHMAIANQIHSNFNHSLVTDAAEDRIIDLFKGSGGTVRTIQDMRLIYEAYGVRKLPARVDFDIFGIGFSDGTLIEHTERIFDHSRPSTKNFLKLLNDII